jgi:hypothetical protein
MKQVEKDEHRTEPARLPTSRRALRNPSHPSPHLASQLIAEACSVLTMQLTRSNTERTFCHPTMIYNCVHNVLPRATCFATSHGSSPLAIKLATTIPSVSANPTLAILNSLSCALLSRLFPSPISVAAASSSSPSSIPNR